MPRITCVLCKLHGHDPEIALCSLCVRKVAKLLRQGKTPNQIGGWNASIRIEAERLERMLAQRTGA